MKRHSLKDLTLIVDPDFAYVEPNSNLQVPKHLNQKVWGYASIDSSSYFLKNKEKRNLSLRLLFANKSKRFPTDEKMLYLLSARYDQTDVYVFEALSVNDPYKITMIFESENKIILTKFENIGEEEYFKLMFVSDELTRDL